MFSGVGKLHSYEHGLKADQSAELLDLQMLGPR